MTQEGMEGPFSRGEGTREVAAFNKKAEGLMHYFNDLGMGESVDLTEEQMAQVRDKNAPKLKATEEMHQKFNEAQRMLNLNAEALDIDNARRLKGAMEDFLIRFELPYGVGRVKDASMTRETGDKSQLDYED